MTIKITPVDAKTAGNDKNTDTQTDKKELPAGEFLVKDSKGRSIILRRPSPRTDIYFPTLFSTAESSNPSFMMEVKLYAFVKSFRQRRFKRTGGDKRRNKKVALNIDLKQILWLVYHGVPWDVAHSFDSIWRTALCIVFSEFEGSTFDYRTMQFEKKQVSDK